MSDRPVDKAEGRVVCGDVGGCERTENSERQSSLKCEMIPIYSALNTMPAYRGGGLTHHISKILLNCNMRKCPGQNIFAMGENRDQLSAINYRNITESTMALVMSTCGNPTNFQLDWIERVKKFSFHLHLSNAKVTF